MTIRDTHILGDHVWTFADEARKLPGVISATVSGFLPNQRVVYRGFFKDRSGSETATALLSDWQVDADYLPTLRMKMIAGRNFSPQLKTDSGCVLINETAARALGFAEPIGKRIYYGKDSASGYTIIGVVRDFNTGSMRNPIDAVIFRLHRDDRAVTFRLTSGDIPRTLKMIKNRYEALADGHPFVYSSLDEDFNRLYAADERSANLFTVFSILAIIIAGMGMFGLVTAVTEARVKEMAIRRMLGARVIHLTFLLSKEYGLVIGLAILIALPAGGWAMHSWLLEFAYRTPLQPEIFVAAPLCATAIAGLIIGVKARQAGKYLYLKN